MDFQLGCGRAYDVRALAMRYYDEGAIMPRFLFVYTQQNMAWLRVGNKGAGEFAFSIGGV
ncbi:MAG TPA: hypothetical protein VFW53_01230 [Gallionella sp.]|nr:hypothetical protein [Gallionella sp.]